MQSIKIEYNLESEFYLLLNSNIPFIFEDLDYSNFEGEKLLKMRRSHLKSIGITYSPNLPSTSKANNTPSASKKEAKAQAQQGVKDTSTNKPNRARANKPCNPVTAHLERYKALEPQQRLWYKVSNHMDIAFQEAMKAGGALKHVTRCSEQYSTRQQFRSNERRYQQIKPAKRIQGKLFKSVQ